MNTLCLPAKQLFSYELTGKFKAPSAEWKHQSFPLTNYELIVMTEGILYLNYNNEKFVVKNGEYLLLPPSPSWRQGFKPSYCAFYWLHFSTQPGELPLILAPDTVLPPHPGKLLYDSADRSDPQTGESRYSDETAAGHRQKRVSFHRFGCHVHQYPDRALRTAYVSASCGELF